LREFPETLYSDKTFEPELTGCLQNQVDSEIHVNLGVSLSKREGGKMESTQSKAIMSHKALYSHREDKSPSFISHERVIYKDQIKERENERRMNPNVKDPFYHLAPSDLEY
jgi:hypothetical protein